MNGYNTLVTKYSSKLVVAFDFDKEKDRSFEV